MSGTIIICVHERVKLATLKRVLQAMAISICSSVRSFVRVFVAEAHAAAVAAHNIAVPYVSSS